MTRCEVGDCGHGQIGCRTQHPSLSVWMKDQDGQIDLKGVRMALGSEE